MHDFLLLLIFSSLGCLIGKSIEPWPDVRASDFTGGLDYGCAGDLILKSVIRKPPAITATHVTAPRGPPPLNNYTTADYG
jgi:hypothetical protein